MKNQVLITIYFTLIFIMLYFACKKEIILQSTVEFISKLFLLVSFLRLVSEKQKRTSFILILSCFFLGDILYKGIIDSFESALVGYVSAYIIFAWYIYMCVLKEKSLFSIFTFSLPFIFSYSVVYIMIGDVGIIWNIVLAISALLISFSASIALLNYAKNRTKKNRLFFIGISLLQMVNLLSTAYNFNISTNEYYYLIFSFLTALAQFLIFQGFITLEKDSQITSLK